MVKSLLTKLFSNRNERILQNIQIIIQKINSLEKIFEKFSDLELKNKTQDFKKRLNKGETLDDLLPESFATVREASKRVFGMRHFDVQLLGGIILHQRCIAEMRTGEGKTLTATLPAYLNALEGKGVHIVTMNDYLAQRDAKKNSILFQFLGLTVGLNISGMSQVLKKNSYYADITYGTNNEYGFDYLRDNMVFCSKEKVQRKLYYALIDEVDSILIDEARTPLIISGSTEDNSELYVKINKIIPFLFLQKSDDSGSFQDIGHFYIDEKQRQVYLTEKGLIKIEQWFIKTKLINPEESLYSSHNIILMYHVISALRAHNLFFKNVDYIVKNNSIIIVDEHTGRTMEGRRWSDGLHQAIEAKENVKIRNENQTLASITFQNYFRLYTKLSGMTGTAITEAREFSAIYDLDTVVIPTNVPMIRRDMPDLIYMTETEKIDAIIKDIQSCIKRKQPVLVGTVSISKSELISNKLNVLNIKHNVLNAKYHEKEAEIIAQAGKPSAVTIATNMAGRGTDIVLGGSLEFILMNQCKYGKTKLAELTKNWEKAHDAVLHSGGLHIIGTERHESRRIDNQLRGRSGRQGDDGSSRFYLSMEDSLLRIFTSDRIIKIMRNLGIKKGEPISHSFVTKAIYNAQQKVENRNFDIRKQLLEYDDVSNEQRRVFYGQRNKIINSTDISYVIRKIFFDVFSALFHSFLKSNKWNSKQEILKLECVLKNDFDLEFPLLQWIKKNKLIKCAYLLEQVIAQSNKNYLLKEKKIGVLNIRTLEKSVMLENFDLFWKEHLSAMEYLRQGIHLRGYAHKDPKQEYKKEACILFKNMLDDIKYKVVATLSSVNFKIK